MDEMQRERANLRLEGTADLRYPDRDAHAKVRRQTKLAAPHDRSASRDASRARLSPSASPRDRSRKWRQINLDVAAIISGAD
jgi:hypothetical protein